MSQLKYKSNLEYNRFFYYQKTDWLYSRVDLYFNCNIPPYENKVSMLEYIRYDYDILMGSVKKS
jgi:hypothetical protein